MEQGFYFYGVLTGFKTEVWRNGQGQTEQLIMSRSWIDNFGRQQFEDVRVIYNPQQCACLAELRDNVGKPLLLPVRQLNKSTKDGSKRWVEYLLPNDAVIPSQAKKPNVAAA